MTGAGALPLPTKQPPKLNPTTTKAIASAIFFTERPLFEWLLMSRAALTAGRTKASHCGLELVPKSHSAYVF